MNEHITPEKFDHLIQSKPSNVAVGIPAVVSSIKHVFGKMPIGRGVRALFSLNQKGKIDCPSCAWADPDDERSKLGEYCENGAKAIADEAMTAKADPAFFSKHSIGDMGNMSDYWLGQQGRLTHPMIKRENSNYYESISWSEAFDLIGRELNQLESPDEATFYTSGRSSNEAAFLYQLFVRQFGTNNLPDCSNMCHESSGVALTETLGLGKGSVTLDDFEHAELIIIMGQNPGTNHPRMLTSLEKAKNNGAKIVSVNPLIETGLLSFKNPQNVSGLVGTGTILSDHYLQIKINSDMALLKALMKVLFEKEAHDPGSVFDLDFIEKCTQGFDLLKTDLNLYSLAQLVDDTGLKKEQIVEVADLLCKNKKIIVCWAMGLTQHQNAVYTIREIVNLLLLKGSIGQQGAGVCPVRGHSNVQGDRTMGIMHLPSEKFLNRLKEIFGFVPPEKKGLDVVSSIKGMLEGSVRVFFALGGNFLSAAPDTNLTAKALGNCKLTVHVSTKLNRSHLVCGSVALILPCLGRTDMDKKDDKAQFLTTENSMGVVQKTQGVLKPLSDQMMSEPKIVAGLAHATLGGKSNLNWLALGNDYDQIRDLIAQCIDGFEEMNTKIHNDFGFYLPNGPRQRVFNTSTGKAFFSSNIWKPISLRSNELLLMTIRSHDQFNTTIYGLNDRYRGIFNERRIVLINESDLALLKMSPYDVVNIVSNYGGVKRSADKFILVPYSIPKGNIAAYFPEANTVVPLDSHADKSHTPTSKSIVVTLEKIGAYNMQTKMATFD